MPSPLAFPVLVADIGGTNARFALVPEPGAAPVPLADVETRRHAGPAAAIAAEVLPRAAVPPRSFVFALAAPIEGDRIAMTNCDWVIDPPALVAGFGLVEMVLFNDFEALSLALPSLGAADLRSIGGGLPAARGTKLVVGPGTGLGAAGLLDVGGRWVPVGGEGGHVTLAPESDRERAMWPHIERPVARVSAETLISGGGLLRLYTALARTDGVTPRFREPAAVTAAAEAGDALAREAVGWLATYLARVAGDLALVFLARGGVFLGGGIPAKLAGLIDPAAFRRAFEERPPHAALLAGIPTALILHERAALLGLAAFASAPETFLVDVAARHWRALLPVK